MQVRATGIGDILGEADSAYLMPAPAFFPSVPLGPRSQKTYLEWFAHRFICAQQSCRLYLDVQRVPCFVWIEVQLFSDHAWRG